MPFRKWHWNIGEINPVLISLSNGKLATGKRYEEILEMILQTRIDIASLSWRFQLTYFFLFE